MDNSSDRSILAAESIDSIVATLGNMNQMERAGLYVGLIRFMGILWADIMRSITIVENQDDVESLLQTSLWLPRSKKSIQQPEAEELSLVQTFSRTTPVTLFASKVLQLQAHFDSMEPEKAARISSLMQSRLLAWRGRWSLPSRSVSRDRVERLCAVLAAFEMEGYEEAAQETEATWAETQWNWVAPYLESDAMEGGAEGDTIPDETLPPTQVGGACGSGDVMVQRRPHGLWEEATEEEKAEIRRHDAAEREDRLKQQQHDEWLWSKVEEQKQQEKQVREHQAWEDWAVRAEMDRSSRQRPAKRFRLQVVVVDKEGTSWLPLTSKGR